MWIDELIFYSRVSKSSWDLGSSPNQGSFQQHRVIADNSPHPNTMFTHISRQFFFERVVFLSEAKNSDQLRLAWWRLWSRKRPSSSSFEPDLRRLWPEVRRECLRRAAATTCLKTWGFWLKPSPAKRQERRSELNRYKNGPSYFQAFEPVKGITDDFQPLRGFSGFYLKPNEPWTLLWVHPIKYF